MQSFITTVKTLMSTPYPYNYPADENLQRNPLSFKYCLCKETVVGNNGVFVQVQLRYNPGTVCMDC